jgi:hypothetical protein
LNSLDKIICSLETRIILFCSTRSRNSVLNLHPFSILVYHIRVSLLSLRKNGIAPSCLCYAYDVTLRYIHDRAIPFLQRRKNSMATWCMSIMIILLHIYLIPCYIIEQFTQNKYKFPCLTTLKLIFLSYFIIRVLTTCAPMSIKAVLGYEFSIETDVTFRGFAFCVGQKL